MVANGGGVMEKPAWEKCQSYSSGRCPQHQIIDRAYLIPQLLDSSQLQDAKKICTDCGKYLDEKRKHQRIKRPFEVVITNQEPKKRIKGTIVDVSINGALIRLDQWIDFDKDEIIKLQLYTKDNNVDNKKAKIIYLYGIIKRLAKEKQQLAIIFLKEAV